MWWIAAGNAAEVLDVGGDLKTFSVMSFPYDHAYMPEDPFGQGIVDFRLKAESHPTDRLKLVAHHAVTAISSSNPLAGGGFSAGVGQQVDQTVDLSWDAGSAASGWSAIGRTDRLLVGLELDGLSMTLGRQPITFGKTMFFTPLDLVNPFNLTVIDQEYKPGVDAFRADAYLSFTTQISVAAAYTGAWDPDGMVFAAYGQSTFGVWDVGPFVGYIEEDLVLGAATAGSIGAVGLRGEGTFTLPPEDEDPFVRTAVGGDVRPTETTTVSGELYYQSLGETEPALYLSKGADRRYLRGELWALGRLYAGLSVSQEIIPELHAGLAAMGNLEDASAILIPSLAWSVDDNSAASLGAYVGVGKRPDVSIESEFGTTPTTVFAQMSAYF